ncbi:MAG: hypothetical protein ACYTGC_11915, partial [Planctomycetota bacterium]
MKWLTAIGIAVLTCTATAEGPTGETWRTEIDTRYEGLMHFEGKGIYVENQLEDLDCIHSQVYALNDIQVGLMVLAGAGDFIMEDGLLFTRDELVVVELQGVWSMVIGRHDIVGGTGPYVNAFGTVESLGYMNNSGMSLGEYVGEFFTGGTVFEREHGLSPDDPLTELFLESGPQCEIEVWLSPDGDAPVMIPPGFEREYWLSP